MDDPLLMMEDERHSRDREYHRLDRYHRDADEEEMDEEESTTSAAADAVGGGKRGQESSVMMRWQKFLPMMTKGKGKERGDGFLRVLLVEGDDSTRQIIAALLRTCSYKVTAFSDGLKAWEMLKERPQSIDVVLAEVDVSSISGISLLSMIMDHESCKNIPVIMMSSDDSINMVFKCMLKGAADFLVKPIRKNELRNLWQHVWRRHISGDGYGSTKVSQDDNTEEKFETKPLHHNQTRESAFPVKNNKDRSEKGSDAESSCTRSDMEAESTYKQNLLESPQASCKSFSHLSDTTRPEEKNQPNGSLGHECEREGESAMVGSECMPVDEELLDEDRSCALAETANEDVKPTGSICNNSIPNDTEDQACDEVMPPRQIIDLIGTIDNQRQFGYGIKENVAEDSNIHDAPEIVFHDEGFSFKGSTPSLELSLRRHLHRSVDTEEKNERSMLNHSDFSAFSLYNSRTKMSPLLRTVNLQSEGEECYSPTSKQIPDKGFSTSSSVPRCHGTMQHGNTEEDESLNFGASGQNGIAIKCSPIRGVPLPIPVGGLQFERSVGHHPPTPPTFYPESSGLLWSSSPSERPEAIRMDASYQAETIDCYTSHQHLHNQPSERPVLYSEQPEYQKVNTELTDEPWHVDTPMPGDSAGSHMCHGDSVRSMDGNGHRRVLNEGNCSGNTSTTRVSHVTSQNEEEKKQVDLYRLHQREAALNKFRLKRKDRCFEKKVRYQSRKRLAEQRPRVKGQFVRHIQPVASSTEAGTCQVEQVVG